MITTTTVPKRAALLLVVLVGLLIVGTGPTGAQTIDSDDGFDFESDDDEVELSGVSGLLRFERTTTSNSMPTTSASRTTTGTSRSATTTSAASVVNR